MPPGFSAAKPPRPRTQVAGWLMIVGAVISGVACFLPFISEGDQSWNGFDEVFFDEEPGGPLFIFLAVVMLGFGITTLAAGRVLAIMIIGIVLAGFGVLGGVAELSDYSDLADDFNVDLGPGLPLIMVGFAISLAGAITGCAKRRRWPSQ